MSGKISDRHSGTTQVTAKVPGIKAKHAVVTPNCRTVPRPHLHEDPEMAAFEEAVQRLRVAYKSCCNGREDGFNAHLVLTIEPEPET